MTPILAELGLVTQGDDRAWAVTSADDRFRYLLGRSWAAGPRWTYCMLNPSKARHDVPDPTMTKCVGFAKRGGAGGIVICNLFAYSATDPADMVAAAVSGVDVAGAHNAEALAWALGSSERRVAAWGKIPPRLRTLAQYGRMAFLSLAGGTAECLGFNSDGSPHHPLMLAYATPFEALVRSC